MLGRKMKPVSRNTWYVMARGGDLVARVRPGHHLGEDVDGDLSFDAANALLELNVGDDGRLMLLAGRQWEFAVGSSQDRTRRVDVARDSRARVTLPNHTLTLGADFTGDGAEPLDVRCVAMPTAAPGNAADTPTKADADTRTKQDADTAADLASERLPPRRSGVRDEGAAAGEPEPRRAPIEELLAALAEAVQTTQPPPEEPPAGAEAPGRPEQAPAPAAPADMHRRLWPVLGITALALVLVVAAGVLYSGYVPKANRIGASRGPSTVVDAGTAERQAMPQSAIDALAGISALLQSGDAHSEQALSVAVQSAKALAAAYPSDPRPQRSLEQLTRRLAAEAMARHDQGAEEAAKRLIQQAETTGAAPQAVSRAMEHISTTSPGMRAPSTPPVEPVVVPEVARLGVPSEPAGDRQSAEPTPDSKVAPQTAPPIAAQEANEPAQRPIASEPATPHPSPQLIARLQAIGVRARAVADDLAVTRDLHAADLALRRGQLVTPEKQNALALYSRVLDQRPESTAARKGLHMVAAALLNRAMASLAGGDPDAALTALDAAADAGADPAAVKDLRSDARYRQRLKDARAGRFDSLTPISELQIVRQTAPRYPSDAPAGAEGSVDLEMTVTETGDVEDLKVLGDPPDYFAQAAADAVSQWQFEPELDHGRPIPIRTSVRVLFRHD